MDNFSQQSSGYARYRPDYPPELFAFILERVKGREHAWDCATGNGQTAKELARHFQQVFATDISERQLEHAERRDNIIYSIQPAEHTNFQDHFFDLITVSQALHWFDFDRFFAEVMRVGRPGSIIAAWVYSLLSVSPEIDRIIGDDFYRQTLGTTYWDKERRHVDEHYAQIPFPFERIPAPVFHMQFHWTLEDLLGYLRTWSAVQHYIRVNKHDPVDELEPRLKAAWKGESMVIHFPLHVLMGKLPT